VPIDVLGEVVSIGTLLAFVLRRTHPDVERPFRVPYVHVVAGLGLLSALGLMAMLPIETWIRLVVWLVIGLTIFFTYARAHTNEKFASLALEED
jgi:basic amino acid/polyamine antiporter, APA family